ncbi:MAG: T9SS type A sorting domain-containing protein, partial [Saprospiraceae bacterium]|nr:T9SS type A sorting domain-containing protein [Saprospiraceae bacterium]
QSGQTQTWDFPSRDQCMSCHNASAGFVLGVKTHQLNGEINYPHLGRSRNQLEYLNDIGVFHRDIGRADELVRAYPVEDISADLDLRIRSYLDANCANCHRPGGVPTTSLDLRFNVPLALQNIINVPTNSQTSDPNRMIVKPGFHESSELWVRDAGLGANRMPPVGRNLVDENYIAALTEWIGQLIDEDGQISELLLFPNPSKGQLSIRIPDEWPAPFRITVQNASGLIVRKETYDSRIIYLDLREQVAGMYFLEIIAGEERWLKKVVIQ